MPEVAQIEEWKQKYGELVSLEFEGQEFVFRAPRRVEYDRWLSRSKEDSTEAARELAQSCVLTDAKEMFAAIERKAALLNAPGGFVDAITELAGLEKGGVKTTKKKL